MYVSDKNGGVNFAILTELQDSAGKLLTVGALICIIRYIIKLFNKVYKKEGRRYGYERENESCSYARNRENGI